MLGDVYKRQGSISAAVATARRVAGFSLRIDVEVRTYEEAEEAVRAGADVVMLDNMDGDELVQNARRLRERLGGEHRFLLESSGGITLQTLADGHVNNGTCVLTAIDIVSTSAIHQSTQHVDYSLKIDH